MAGCKQASLGTAAVCAPYAALHTLRTGGYARAPLKYKVLTDSAYVHLLGPSSAFPHTRLEPCGHTGTLQDGVARG